MFYSIACEFDVVENSFNMNESLLFRLSANEKLK